jgi:hypothetical protein
LLVRIPLTIREFWLIYINGNSASLVQIGERQAPAGKHPRLPEKSGHVCQARLASPFDRAWQN